MKVQGFTFIELIITMVLIAVLSTVALSSYSYLLHRNEQQRLIDELRTAVQYAKIQALSLGKPVALSSLDDSRDWSHGLLLSTTNEKTKEQEFLYQWQWHHPRWNVTWNGAGATDKIIFSPNPATAISNGRFILFNRNTHQKIELILNRIGRVKLVYMMEGK